jgi:hypothetical protein
MSISIVYNIIHKWQLNFEQNYQANCSKFCLDFSVHYNVKLEDVGDAEKVRGKGERKEAIEKQYSKLKEPYIISNSKDIGILDNSKESDKIEANTVWHQIRKTLREELGEAIDTVWFAKVIATECKDTKTLTLTMPTRFMADFLRNNYSHVIRRLSEGIRLKLSHNC